MKKLLFLLLFVPCGTYAAPAITSVSGTISHGQTLTIAGSGFTTKATATPLVFDTLESGSFDGYWGLTNDLAVGTANQRSSNSSKNAHLNFINGSDNGSLQGTNTSYERWFISWWEYVHTNFDWGTSVYAGTDKWLSNIKLLRLWDSGAEADNWYAQYEGWGDDAFWITEDVEGTEHYFLSTWRTNYTRGTWHLWEVEFNDSTVSGSDGELRIWVDGVSQVSVTNMQSRNGTSVFKRIQSLGFKNSWSYNEGTPDPEGDQAPNDYYLDDIYADNVWNRVFVSTNSTLSATTFKEYSAPTSWGATSIQITFNAGQWNPSSDTLYLYVKDSAGTANASGYELSGASTGKAFAVTGGVSFTGGVTLR